MAEKEKKVARTYRLEADLVEAIEAATGGKGMTGWLEDAIRRKLEGPGECPSCRRSHPLDGKAPIIRQGVVYGPKGPRGFRPAR